MFCRFLTSKFSGRRPHCKRRGRANVSPPNRTISIDPKGWTLSIMAIPQFLSGWDGATAGRSDASKRRWPRSTTREAAGGFARIFGQGFFFAGVGVGAASAGFASRAA